MKKNLKSPKRIYLRIVNTLLATIGILLGFSNEVVAQYGAPEYYYKQQQTVKTEIVSEKAIKNNRLLPVYKNNEPYEIKNCVFIKPNTSDTTIQLQPKNLPVEIVNPQIASIPDTFSGPLPNLVQLVLYPNPNEGIFTVEFTCKDENDIFIKLFDTKGQFLFEDKIKNYKGVFRKQYNIEQYAPGIYLMQVLSGTEVYSLRIVKEH
jgi:hypothetical protein